ncbi:hypothetical protein FS827_00070 [Agrobacterium vitis]|uniref:hypothetical protein n=1 Tax=Allorhizobium ampelinum TaxID=3025782 RepID=UPI001F219CD5|nr:hypothetical protein [Allorhizobium ampelinum]MCF1459710.1 hypothetical protein [Allorhizobium ampelinum]
MLQIVQGAYFRPVPLTDTLHRGVFHTNLWSFRAQALEFTFGRILPSTAFGRLRTLTVEARERLETLSLNGTPEVLVATNGDQLLDEIADVIAFHLNVVCVRDLDTARRLIVPGDGEATQMRGPASILRQTFDASVILKDEAIAGFDRFVRELVALERSHYEAAMRALRQVVSATLIVDEDATLAYTLMVAALESLGQAAEPHIATWEEYDRTKRARIDAAMEGFDDKSRDAVRAAVLANEHIGLQRRFVAFVLGHIEPRFYREEAIGAIRPIAALDLPKALRQAYAIRSRNVHALTRIAPEMFLSSDRSDTAWVDGDTLLGLEGLTRLSRHVICNYVARAPKGVTENFNYRSALPGIIRGRLASQYWIHNAAGFDHKSAPDYLEGMLYFLIEGLSGRNEAGLVGMNSVLDRIEAITPSLADRDQRLPMVGMMALWNEFAPVGDRRALKSKLQKQFDTDLSEPSMAAFAVTLLAGQELPWDLDALCALSAARAVERSSNSAQPMPARIDAALNLLVADGLLDRGDRDAGLLELARAVETVPGLADLVRYEQRIRAGEDPTLDLRKFMLSQDGFLAEKADGDLPNDIAPPDEEQLPSE